MCRLTGKQHFPSGAAGVVLWNFAALKLWKTHLAVARFPLRGRISGGSRRSGRVSTNNLLTQPATHEEAHRVPLSCGTKGSQAVLEEEEARLVKGRGGGRKRLGQEKIDSLKRVGLLHEVSPGGKTGGCGVLSSVCLKKTSSENFYQGKLFVKRGKTDPPVSTRHKITPSLRSYFKILPLVASDDSTRLVGLEEGAQPSGSKRMEVAPIEGSVETTGEDGGGEKDQCSVAMVDFNLQEDRTGEPSQVLTGNDNAGLGVLQMSRLEGRGELVVSLPRKRCLQN
ncbi:hypothetical protein NDU88_003509 [Pleurodeles waltl]|uniref:Uncharacterized protein n=1 Tax=Pleurodeles waltl TaxID=8319 RepID=A0AAV7NGL5_PLEWA|nr:hypothetical protein NDU88_003509 [Pleurodeles waltl]